MIESAIHWLLHALAIPHVGLLSVFFISFISATLLPMGSEPTVFAVIKVNGALFWPVIVVATVGNTLGGAVDYWMGYGARNLFAKERERRWLACLQRFGAKVLMLAWLPVIGDLLCTLAGWSRIAFWPSVFYMALGKLLRYVLVTWLLLAVPDGWWRQVAQWIG